MDLQSSLFRALAVILLALQCCVLPVCGKPAATQPGVGAVQSDRADSDAVKGASGPGRAPGADGAEGAADEEDYFDDYEDYESWKDSYDDADDMPAEQEEKVSRKYRTQFFRHVCQTSVFCNQLHTDCIQYY